MNGETLSPNNNSTSKMKKSKIVSSFLFKTDEKFAKTIKKGMSSFNDPAPASKSRICLLFLIFLPSGTNMDDISHCLGNLFTAAISCIHTEILWVFWSWFRTFYSKAAQSRRKKLDIMPVCSIQDNRKRDPLFIYQYAPFCPHFFPDRLDYGPLPPVLTALSPYCHPHFCYYFLELL
mgnify:CR=1 FL=1